MSTKQTFAEKVSNRQILAGIVTLFVVVAGVTLWPSDYKTALEESETPYVVMDNWARGYHDVVTHSKVADYQRYKLDSTTTTLYKGRAMMAESTWLLEYWKTYGDDEWVNLNRKVRLIERGIETDETSVSIYRTIPFYLTKSRSGTAGYLTETIEMSGYGENKFTVDFTPQTARKNRLIWRVKLLKYDIKESETITGICRYIVPQDDYVVIDACDSADSIDKFVLDAEKDSVYVYFTPAVGRQYIDPQVGFYSPVTLGNPANSTAHDSTGTDTDNTWGIWFNWTSNSTQTVFDLMVFNGSFNKSGNGINESIARGFLVLNKTGLGDPEYNLTEAEALDQGTYYWIVRGTSAENYFAGLTGANSSVWVGAYDFTVVTNATYDSHSITSAAPYNNTDLTVKITPTWPAGSTQSSCIFESNFDAGTWTNYTMADAGSGVYNYTINGANVTNQLNRSYIMHCFNTLGTKASNSTSYTFEVLNRQPPAPAIETISNGFQTNNTAGGIVLNWTTIAEPDQDDVQYTVIVYNDSAFSEELETIVNLTTSEGIIANVTPDTTYFWKVQAIDSAGVTTATNTYNENSTGNWSAVYNFSVETTVPTTVLHLGNLTNGTNTTDNSAFFNWSAIVEANFDHYELNITDGSSVTVYSTTVDNVEWVNYTHTTNMTDGQYDWTVRGCQINGTCGVWSTANVNITIDTIPPTLTLNITPHVAIQDLDNVQLVTNWLDANLYNSTLQTDWLSVNVTAPNGSAIMPSEITANYTWSAGADIKTIGVYEVVAWVKDWLGNAVTKTTSFKVIP